MTRPGDARLLTVDDAAWFLGVSAKTVYRECNAGRMPHRKVGRWLRFTEADLDAYVDAKARPAEALEEPQEAVEAVPEQPVARRPRRRYPRVVEDPET